MSPDRNVHGLHHSSTTRPLLASARNAATPRAALTPRIAGTATPPPAAARLTPRVPNRAAVVSPRLKAQATPAKDVVGSGATVTPRSAPRKSRPGGTWPAQDDIAVDPRVKESRAPADAYGRGSAAGSLSLPRAQASRPNSDASEIGPRPFGSPMLPRSHGVAELNHSTESIERRFFHANEAARQEPAPRRPEPKKTPTFFYADGQEDRSPTSPSPVLSAVNDARPSGPWIKSDVQPNIAAKSPSVILPSAAHVNTSFLPPTLSNRLRSLSPSKENIHLSDRKGASQYSATPDTRTEQVSDENRNPSYRSQHRKSNSLSSMSSLSQPRIRPNTALEGDNCPPHQHTEDLGVLLASKPASPRVELTSIETTAAPALVASPSESALSLTKSASQLAADARRERKVLDLEISNRSLLAINSSLERELRRQKAELKRFRRLSRAGRLSFALGESATRRKSEGLGISREDGEDADSSGLLSELAEDDITASEDDDESVVSGSEPLSPAAQSSRQQDRLAKDEKRLQVDLQRHKELLVQSQAMNQSLKRCMYATEEMVREGRKALEYHVRVSDVKLGGRILTGFEHEGENDEIEGAGEFDGADDDVKAQGVLGTWSRVGRSGIGSDSGDRDSGIEVDKRPVDVSTPSGHSGRPPDLPG